MEMEEVVKILFAVVFLVIMVTAVILLFKTGGGNLLDGVRNIFKFGGR